MQFKYKAKKGTKDIVSGVISAESESQAVDLLVNQGLFPVDITVQTISASPPNKATKNVFGKKVNTKDLLLFTQNLATLTRAKMELLLSLDMLDQQIDNPYFKEVFSKISLEVKEGESFSDALAKFPQIFSPLYVSTVKAGEKSGNMGPALAQIVEYMQANKKLKSKVMSALLYPSILLGIGVVSIIVIMNFVIPKLSVIFGEVGTKLPLATKIVLRASEFSRSYGLLTILVLATVGLGLSFFARSILQSTLRQVTLRLPVVGRLIKNQELVNFTKAFRLLMGSGINPLDSLKIASFGVSTRKMKAQFEAAAEEIKDGQSIAASFSKVERLPDLFKKMIAVGEKAGRLDEVLDELIASYMQEIESDIAIITAVIEPVLILILGVILGAIVLSILLPIFQITYMIN